MRVSVFSIEDMHRTTILMLERHEVNHVHVHIYIHIHIHIDIPIPIPIDI